MSVTTVTPMAVIQVPPEKSPLLAFLLVLFFAGLGGLYLSIKFALVTFLAIFFTLGLAWFVMPFVAWHLAAKGNRERAQLLGAS